MVLVYSDEKKLTLELLNPASKLARETNSKVTVAQISNTDSSQEYIEHGADRVIFTEPPREGVFKVDEYAEILEHIIKETKSKIVLIGSNKNGKELAGHLAARLNTGCETDCINIYIKNKHLHIERVVYSGNAIATIEFLSEPCIVTIPPRLFDPLPSDKKHKGEILKKKYDTKPSSLKIIDVKQFKKDKINVEDAEIIISCGRGLKNKDDIRLINDIAKILNGTTIGCSRPIAADLKWLSEDHWIGLSGHKVKPKLYIACGISGQIQHIAGMRDSNIIVAINKDPDALIFKSADYGIVGDLYEVLPKLASTIKEKIKG
ncbi:MAG: electron transfer flavoprotein subunit alpha/FixB family protein [Candidatus Thermoplasmatota archaeon]